MIELGIYNFALHCGFVRMLPTASPIINHYFDSVGPHLLQVMVGMI